MALCVLGSLTGSLQVNQSITVVRLDKIQESTRIVIGATVDWFNHNLKPSAHCVVLFTRSLVDLQFAMGLSGNFVLWIITHLLEIQLAYHPVNHRTLSSLNKCHCSFLYMATSQQTGKVNTSHWVSLGRFQRLHLNMAVTSLDKMHIFSYYYYPVAH